MLHSLVTVTKDCFLFEIIIFRFILLGELFWQKRFNYFVNRINWKSEEAAIKIESVSLWIYNKTD